MDCISYRCRHCGEWTGASESEVGRQYACVYCKEMSEVPSKEKAKQANWESRAQDPEAWALRSWGLRASAKLLLECYRELLKGPDAGPIPDFQPVERVRRTESLWSCLLLYGFAVETALKAKLVLAGEITIDENGDLSVPRGRGGHDLVELAKKAKLLGNGDKDREQALRYMTEVILWQGRYPTQKKLSSTQSGGMSNNAGDAIHHVEAILTEILGCEDVEEESPRAGRSLKPKLPERFRTRCQ